MRILILGGTVFLGRYLVEVAQKRGHLVTLFNRGRTAPDLFPDVPLIRGDRGGDRGGDREDGREGDLSGLADGRWDAVVDTCGYLPDIVQASATALSGRVGHYLFVSSASVLADASRPGLDESAPLATLPEGASRCEVTPEHYGALKSLCEEAVRESFDGRVTVIRPGLIVGPHDPSDRFTYWPRRIAKGGEVLCPAPDKRVQILHAGDLADWIVRLAEARVEGTFLAAGPKEPFTLGQLLGGCHQVADSDAFYTAVDDEFLLEQGIGPFVELPLWIPGDDSNFMALDCHAAWEAGLAVRSLAQTIAETLEWDANRPRDTEVRAGLLPEREQELLDAWHALTDPPA